MSNSNSSNTFFDISKVEIIDVYVTQKIKQQYLAEFLKTNLELNYKIIDKNSYIWYNFIESINLYEIYLLNCETNQFDILPNTLSNFYPNDTKSTDLFICSNFFAIYRNSNLLSFRVFDNSTAEDIITFATQKYRFTLDNVYTIDDIALKQLIQKENRNKINFIKLIEDKSYLYFLSYFTITCVIFVWFVYSNYFDLIKLKNDEYKNLQNKLASFGTKKKNHNITAELIEIFKYIKINDITTNEIKFADKQLVLDLYHPNKQKLLDFLTQYNQKVSLEQLNFIEDKQIFKMVIKSEI